MFEGIKDFFRKRRLSKSVSTVQTGLLSLETIKTANVVIDVEEPGFDVLKEDILAWGRQHGIKVNIYFLDLRKLGKEELLLTSIQTTILRKELDWLGIPDMGKLGGLINEQSDLFISMVEHESFTVDFLCKCAKARFKIGRTEYPGHSYDLIISGAQTEDLRSDSRRIFKTMTEFLTKIR